MKKIPPFLTLTLIALVAALLLAGTDAITREPIRQAALMASDAARIAVFPEANSFEEVEASDVDALYDAKKDGQLIGHVAVVTSQGFAGPVEVTVGMSTDGVITGLSVGGSAFAETAGLGTKAQEPAFTDQFVGKTAPVELNADVDAVSGATITSRAVVSAVNIGAGAMGIDVSTLAEAPKTVIVEADGSLTASAQGFAGPVGVTVALDADGKIISLTVGGTGFAETLGFGSKAQEEAFTSQFIGKAIPTAYGDGIDAIAGATITSTAVMQALTDIATTPAEARTPAGEAAAVPTEEAKPADTTSHASSEVAEQPDLTAADLCAKVFPTANAYNEQTAPEGLLWLYTAEADGILGYVATASAQGFAGPVEVTIGVDNEGKLTGIYVGGKGFAETSGFGSKAQEEAFTSQFMGKAVPAAYGDGIDAIAGATVTSNAVMKALTAAAAGIPTLAGEANPAGEATPAEARTPTGEAAAVPTEEAKPADTTSHASSEVAEQPDLTPADLCAKVFPTANAYNDQTAPEGLLWLYTAEADGILGYVATASAQGFAGPVEVTIGVDNEGKFTGIYVGGKGFAETSGFGSKAQEEAFTSQFMGKAVPAAYGDGIDAIAGATVTSNAVMKALTAAAAGISNVTK